jgi:carboxylesterase
MWIEDIQKGYDKLKETCPKVYIAGTSLGAILTMMFAEENQEIAGIMLMAAPYKLKLEKLVVFIAKILVMFGKKYSKKFYPPTFGARTTITRLISYQTYPIINAFETYDLIKKTRKNLKKITQPCLILQSTHDHIVEKDSMEMIYDKINSKIKKKKYIQKAYHTFISDIKQEQVFQDIFNFLDEN